MEPNTGTAISRSGREARPLHRGERHCFLPVVGPAPRRTAELDMQRIRVREHPAPSAPAERSRAAAAQRVEDEPGALHEPEDPDVPRWRQGPDLVWGL